VPSLETENPVSVTAFWVLAARYADATGPRPVANDTFAERFMDEDARAVAQRFASLKRPNASFPVRHRIIDDMLRRELEEDRGRRVVVIGSGFDSRPFRLEGGRWVELDEPALLRRKEARLPVSEAPNELVRVPIRFAEDSLDDKLRPFATDDRAVSIEGVIRPRRSAAPGAADDLGRLVPRHRLICDLSRDVPRRYGRRFVRILEDRRAVRPSDDAPGAWLPSSATTCEHVSVVSEPSSWARGASAGIRSSPAAEPARGYQVWLFDHGRETELVITAPL
jgi:hypothetical protein